MAQPKDKKKKVTEKDPSKYINVEPILDEAQKGTAVFAWGRMNPMTAGHEKLVQKVASVAKAEKGIPHVFLTHSFDKKKNPLAYDDKIKYAQKAFGDIVKKSSSKTIFQLMKQLNTRFNRVILVAGSDRVKEFNDTLNKYNGKEYKFDEIRVVSAGARDPDADDVSGISGTKMRGFAVDDMDKFKKNLPKRIQADAEEIASLVRKGMNMSESEEIHIDDMEPLDEALTRQQRRQRSLLMRKYKNKMKRGREKAKKRTATLDVLKKRARKEAITSLKQKFAKNRRYAELSYAEKEIIDKRVEKISKERIERLAKKLLPKVKERERSRKISMAKGGSTNESLDTRFEMFLEDYYKGVPKDKKDDREAHFKRHAEKPSDGPDKDSNYKPAPGDFKDGERVKTKLSKHTKKYRDMFGEETLEEAKGLWGTYVTKKPHMLMDKNNKPKFDGRFKMFKKKVNESAEDLNEEILDLMEATEVFVEEHGAGDEGTDKLVKKYKKDTPLSERSTGEQIKVALSKVVNKKGYQAALKMMKDKGYSAAKAAQIYRGVDARELAKMAESVELDEAIKFKINKNTYFMGKDVGPVYTHHSGYSIAKVGGKWIISNPDDEKAGEFKSLAAAKSEVADLTESVELEEVSSNLLRRAADSAAKKGDAARQRGMTAAHGLQSTKAHADEAEKRTKQRGKFSRASTAKTMKELGIKEGWQEREKRAFKRKEHEAEWKRDQEIERRKKQTDSEEHHVYINGKVWKKDGKPVAFNGKRHANSAALSIQKKDPKKEVRLAHHSYTKKNGGVIKK